MPPAAGRIRRRIAALLGLLAIGAIGTVAICWIPAAYLDVWPGSRESAWLVRNAPAGGPAPASGRVASISINENARALGTGWDVMYSTNSAQSGVSAPPLRIPLWIDADLRPWATAHDGVERLDSADWPRDVCFPSPQYAISAVDIRAFGWPARAMYTVGRWKGFDGANKPTWSLEGGVRIAGTTAPDGHYAPGPITLPIRIRPLGFAIDTLAFATGAAVLLAPLVALRHALARAARRRNRCEGCGYDLRATPSDRPCPECGRGRGISR
ncbi:MAG TPA: hypothetical protein VHC70_08645 [Phycisphaerales bacterium]|nr:hypothetical protein [Phycisphaerales bacterium]